MNLPHVRFLYRIKTQEDAPAQARAIIDQQLGHLVRVQTLEELELMVSELVTAALRQRRTAAPSAVMLDVRIGEEIRCSVTTPGRRMGVTLAGGAMDGGGPLSAADHGRPGHEWALRTVAWLAERWGISRAGHLTRVWFESGRA